MENKHNESWAAYTRGTHRIGRICTLITLCLLVGAPFLMGSYLGALPDLGAVAKAFCPWVSSGPSAAWWSSSSTPPCWARAADTSPSSPATSST